MPQASSKRNRKAKIATALTVAFVALFALAFIGVVTMLNDYADELESEPDIEIGSIAPTEPFYVLLIGSDSRKGTAIYTGKTGEPSQTDQYADVITLMRIDPQTYTITLVTVPRDTVPNGQTGKINAALKSNDPQDVVDTVSELTGVQVDYYMMTTFISFENLVNAIGGVDVDVPKTVTMVDPATGKKVTVKEGKNQHLNGSEALVLVRARKEYDSNQDALRQVNARSVETAMIEKVLDMDGDFDVEHVLAAIEDDTKTNLDLPMMGLLMMHFVEFADEVEIYNGTGPYNGKTRAKDDAWVIAADEMAWEELMAVVDAGQDPSSLIKPPKF